MKISCLDSLLKIAEETQTPQQRQYTPGDSERYFFNEIATPNKLKYVGSPEEANYNGSKNHSDFFLDIPTYEYAGAGLGTAQHPRATGWYHRSKDENGKSVPGYVAFRGAGHPSVFVHEHTHHRTLPTGQDVPTPEMDPSMGPEMKKNRAGLPYRPWNELTEIYGLGNSGALPAITTASGKPFDYRIEAPTIHAERQYNHMLQYGYLHGAMPTAEQLDQYFADMPVSDLKKDLVYGPGGYSDVVRKDEQAADRARYEEAARKYQEWYENLKALREKRSGLFGRDFGAFEVLRPGVTEKQESDFPVLSIQEARDTDWYKEDPEFFESLFNEEDADAISEAGNQGGWSYGLGENGNLILWPQSVLARKYSEDLDALRKAAPQKPKLEDYQTGEDVSDEDAERYREALRHIWSKNDGVKNYDIV